jgi:hypothetical protein
LLAATLLGLSPPPPLSAQVVATGVVLDASTRLPLPGVEVVVEGHNRSAFTDSLGRYRLEGVPDGPRVVLFRLLGYRPVRTLAPFKRGETTKVDGMMIGLAVNLDSILVRGSPGRARGTGVGREAFEERRRMGFGIFYDSTMLRRNEHRRLDDLLRGELGIRVGSRAPDGGRYILSARGTNSCYLHFYYDGIPIGRGGREGNLGVSPTSTGMFDLASVEKVEIYRGAAEVPMEYGGPFAICGVVLIWSRRGP